MTPVLHLEDWDPLPPGATRAGSLYAVPPSARVPAAREVAAAGWWVHVDVIVDRSGNPDAGVPLATLASLHRDLPTAAVEVHVIDLSGGRGAGAVLDDVLDDVLAAAPDRVILPGKLCGHGSPAAALVRRRGAELWAEIDGSVPTDLDADGVLVMLIDPGTTQSVDLSRLAVVGQVPAGRRRGADGGITREHTAELLAAGISHLVSGRALLSPAAASPGS